MRPNILNVLILALGAIATAVLLSLTGTPVALLGLIPIVLVGLAPKIANQWERAIVLRLGRYRASRGPGVFWIIPGIDHITAWVDQRVVTTPFRAEQTLSRDTVPVTVDAVLFWHVHDTEQAALEVQDFAAAVSWASQTALRDLIGRTTLADMLTGREKMEQQLQEMIDKRCNPWGVTVQTVEMRDVVIPEGLQDAMSREAQAEREKNARVILGDAEVLIAKQFAEASRQYHGNPVALHLRAMNMLYEGLKEKGALMVVPSSAVETMGLGAISGLGAMQGAFPGLTEPRREVTAGTPPPPPAAT